MPLERNLLIHRNKDLSFCCPIAIRLLSFRDPILLQSLFPSFRRPFWAGACKGFFYRGRQLFLRARREKIFLLPGRFVTAPPILHFTWGGKEFILGGERREEDNFHKKTHFFL